MQFVHSALTWGFLLALVPLLIHLINMMRHQRVRWAAMEFLQQSYKKHRKWIWLKQLVLLVMRMAAIGLLVAMLAQWVTRDQWLELLGDRSVHHFVLLDDSYSMTERSSAATAFDVARQVVSRITARAANTDEGQKLTLIRFSRAAQGGAGPNTKAQILQLADFNAEPIGSNMDVLLEEKRTSMEPTQLAVGPRESVDLVRQLLETDARDKNVVYVISDFRANQWENPSELRDSLRQLEKAGAELHLVNCAKAVQPNLAVTGIQPSDETRAAGVPLFISIDVKNFGPGLAQKVQLRVNTIYFSPELTAAGEVDNARGDAEELPTILIDEIKPGETVSRRVQVFFPKPGQHVVEAILPEDAVSTDNRRFCVVDFAEGEPVLVIDGEPQQRNAYYLTSAFDPGKRANTGIRATVQKPAYLRDAAPADLQAFRAIYLLDVDKLDDRAVENLESFVRGGGGLAIFAGPQSQVARYNQQLYKGGEGLLPVPLDREDVLPPELSENIPDLDLEPHPVFQPFLGESNSYIQLITIDKYLRVKSDWNPPADSTVEVIARLRNRQPFAVERKFGEGRVIAFLTSVAPDWNNWAHDPTFVVLQLKLESYLASSARRTESHLVGTPLEVHLEADKYRRDIKFVAPGEKSGTRLVLDRTLQRPAEQRTFATAELGLSEDGEPAVDETARSGIYEAWPVTNEGVFQVRRYAFNVDPSEGDLAVTEAQRLAVKLDPLKFQFHQADEYEFDLGEQPGINRSLLVMALLVGLLLVEQLLSYRASYHPGRAAVPLTTGVSRG